MEYSFGGWWLDRLGGQYAGRQWWRYCDKYRRGNVDASLAGFLLNPLIGGVTS